MDMQKQMRIRLTSEEVEEIVKQHIDTLMLSNGYELMSERIEDGVGFPDMYYLGKRIKE